MRNMWRVNLLKVVTLKRTVIIAIICTISATVNPQDWYDCEYQLSRLVKAARSAEYAAIDVESYADTYENSLSLAEDARDQYENCISYPSVYDLWQDDCDSYRIEYNRTVDEYESARSSYRASIDDLVYYLDALNKVLRSIQYSCEYSFSLGTFGTTVSPRRTQTQETVPNSDFCVELQNYRRVMSDSALVALCQRLNIVEECKECLNIK